MNGLFGTDGVRGVANEFLTPELAFALGRAGGFVLVRHGAQRPVLVGRDTRMSGPMLEAALCAGLARSDSTPGSSASSRRPAWRT